MLPTTESRWNNVDGQNLKFTDRIYEGVPCGRRRTPIPYPFLYPYKNYAAEHQAWQVERIKHVARAIPLCLCPLKTDKPGERLATQPAALWNLRSPWVLFLWCTSQA